MTSSSLLRTAALGSLALSMLLSSCVVAPYGPGCAYHQPCGYGGGGYAQPAEGTVGGALLGAAAGGIIGHQSGRGLEGAALGGLLGALAGGAMQSSRDASYYRPAYNTYYSRQSQWQPEPDYGYGYDYNDPYGY